MGEAQAAIGDAVKAGKYYRFYTRFLANSVPSSAVNYGKRDKPQSGFSCSRIRVAFRCPFAR